MIKQRKDTVTVVTVTVTVVKLVHGIIIIHMKAIMMSLLVTFPIITKDLVILLTDLETF